MDLPQISGKTFYLPSQTPQMQYELNDDSLRAASSEEPIDDKKFS